MYALEMFAPEMLEDSLPTRRWISTRNYPIGRGVLSLGLLLSLLGGCGPGTGEGEPRELRHPPSVQVPVLALEAEEACPAWRWIGVQQDAHRDLACPHLDGWTSRHLFAAAPGTRRTGGFGEGAADDFVDDPHAIPPGLRPFCLYEHPEGGEDLSGAYLPGLSALGRDCMAVTPAASELARRALPALERHFLSQTGRVVLPPVAGAAPARLAVIDTAPTNAASPETDPFNSPHGYTLVHMAKRLLCDPAVPGCVARVTSRLALPWVVFDPASRQASVRDDLRGGYVGLIGELAEALRAEVAAQQTAGAPPLVLNLSVGWRPVFGGLEADVTTMRPAVQAVYRALEDAFCRGAVAVAAAGNQDGGPDPGSGPLLPAAWEARAAPDAARCAAAAGLPGPVPAAGAYRPLLYAAGGIRASGDPIFNARFGAEPRRVAFADHGAVGPVVPAPDPAVLTGTSVGALVVSAAAAAVRHYLPALPPSGVVERLDRQGEDLGRAADFCLEGDAKDCSGRGRAVRRVDVCPAARDACRACRGAGCPDTCPAVCPPRERLDLDTAALVQTVQGGQGGAGGSAVDLRGAPAPRTSPACPPAAVVAWQNPAAAPQAGGGGQERLHFAADEGSQTFPCPRWQAADVTAQALTGPQPGSNPCPSCTLDRDSGNLTLEIDDGYPGALSFPTLQVGLEVFALDLDLAAVGPAPALVTGVPVGPAAAGQPVLLSFLVDGERSVTSPVLVVP